MVQANKTFRIFISSTFNDLKEERDALQQYVFPRLQQLCAQHSCRFQAIDLRWGISDAASRDQQSIKICFEEIERCLSVTSRPNFIILLGDRYGWRPLPTEIPANEFEEILNHVTNPNDKALLVCDAQPRRESEGWYLRDDNAKPAVYCLRPRTGDLVDYTRWQPVERRLHSILLQATAEMALTEEEKLKYLASVTEQEIMRGLNFDEAKEDVFCFFRTITNLDDLIDDLSQSELAASYIDVEESSRPNLVPDRNALSLKKDLKRRLYRSLAGNIHEYRAEWRANGITTDHIGKLPEALEDCLELLENDHAPSNLCVDVWRRLGRVVLEEIRKVQSVDPLEKEIDDHSSFGAELAKSFEFRAPYLQAINVYVDGPGRYPYVIWGDSGSGKSALMARAAEVVHNEHPEAEVIARFIGATPGSTDGRLLLEALCRQIGRAYEYDDTSEATDYNDLVNEFPRRLVSATADKPLFIFIDGLDQLSDFHRARYLTWLPTSLPEHARLIVSTLPGECLRVLKARIPADNVTELKPMLPDEGPKLLTLWLGQEGRTLQSNQREEVLRKLDGCRLPLYFRLVFAKTRNWKSFSRDSELSPNIPGMIQSLFEQLSSEANHGKLLVSRCFGYMVAAKYGLSEDEILDVLSYDDEVFKEVVRRAHYEPPEKRVPVAVWSRLFFDVKPYLIERSADGAFLLTFYHGELREVAAGRYLEGDEKRERHRKLARYFAEQPLQFGKNGETTPNLRKMSELPFQQTYGECWKQLCHTLTDFQFLEAKSIHSFPSGAKAEGGKPFYKGVYALLEDLQLALKHLPRETPALSHELHNREMVEMVSDAIRAQSHNILCAAHLFYQQVRYQLELNGRQEIFQEIFRDGEARFETQGRAWLKPLKLKTRQPPLFTLSGHLGSVIDCAISDDGTLAASTGQDMTVRIWDLQSAEMIHVLGETLTLHVCRDSQAVARNALMRMVTGYAGTVRACGFSRDQNYVVSVGLAEAVTVWDVTTGAKLCEITEIDGFVQACLLYLDPDLTGLLIFTCTKNNVQETTAYNISTGKKLKVDEQSSGDVRQMIGSPGGKTLVLVNAEGLPRMQDITSADEQSVLADYIWLNHHDRGLLGEGKALALSDQHLLVSYTPFDVHVIDVQARDHLHVLGVQDDFIINCAVARNTSLAATSTGKGVASVWDLENGREVMRLDLGTTVHGCAFAPDGNYLLTADGNLLTEDFSGRGGLLRAWPISEQPIKNRISGSPVKAFYHFHPATYFLHATDRGGLFLHDLKGNTRSMPFDLPPDAIKHCLLDGCTGKLFFAGDEAGLKCLEVNQQATGVKTLSDCGIAILAGSRGGGLLASLNTGQVIEVWDAQTDTKLSTQSCPDDEITQLFMAPDSSRVFGVGGSKIHWLSLPSQRCALLLDSTETVYDAWERLRDLLASQKIPARPLDPSNYREEFLDAVLTGDSKHLVTVSRLVPKGDPYAFQFVFTKHGMDSARHLDPFPHYSLISAWSFAGRDRVWVDIAREDHCKIQVVPDSSFITWVTRHMKAYGVRIYDMTDGELSEKLEIGSAVRPEIAVTLGDNVLATIDTEGLLSAYQLPGLNLLCGGYINESGLSCVSIIEETGVVLLGYESGNVDVLHMQNLARRVPRSTVMRRWLTGGDGTPARWDDKFTALCPSCADRIAFDDKKLVKRTREHPFGILGTQVDCPQCNAPFMLSQFVVDNRAAWPEESSVPYFSQRVIDSDDEMLDEDLDEFEADLFKEASELDRYRKQSERIAAELRAGAYTEHLSELLKLLALVPIIWFTTGLLAAIIIETGSRQIFALPVYGLIPGYFVLFVQLFRFVWPGLFPKERRIGLTLLAILPIVLSFLMILLTLAFRAIEYLWYPFLPVSLKVELLTLIAKANVVLPFLALAAVAVFWGRSLAGSIKQLIYRLRWVILTGIVLIMSPSIISWAILMLLSVVVCLMSLFWLIRRIGSAKLAHKIKE